MCAISCFPALYMTFYALLRNCYALLLQYYYTAHITNKFYLAITMECNERSIFYIMQFVACDVLKI